MQMRLQGRNIDIKAKRSRINSNSNSHSHRVVNNSNNNDTNRSRNSQILTIQSQQLQQVSNLQTINTDNNQQFITLPNNRNNQFNNNTYTNNNNNNNLISSSSSILPKRPLTSNKHNISSSSQHLSQLRKSNLINILSTKSPQQRTQKQLNIIMQSLKYQSFFTSIVGNIKLLEQISAQIKYKLCKQGETMKLTNQGDQNKKVDSNRCYVIIKGNIDLLLLQQEINDIRHYQQQQKQQQQQEYKVQQSQIAECEQKLRNITVTNQTFWSPTQCLFVQPKISLIKKQQQQQQKLNQLVVQTRRQFNSQQVGDIIPLEQQKPKLLKSFTQSQCFAHFIQPINTHLQQLNPTTNNLLLLPTSTTHLISISKQHFNTIITANKANQTKKLIDFLSNLQLFKLVYRYSIESFINSMEQVHYQYKGYLYKEGDSIQHVYIIKNGQFSLSKVVNPNIKTNTNTNANTNSNPNNINTINQQTNDNQGTNNNKHSLLPSPIDPNNQILSLKRQQNNYRQAQIKNINIGEIIGDSQSYLKIQNYSQSCKCITQSATVYKIDKYTFLEKLLSSQNQTLLIKNYLSNKYRNKLKQIQSFMNKHLNNQIILRIWPVSKSCDRKLKASKSSLAQRPSTASKKITQTSYDFFAPNFFDEFNRTIPKNKQRKRINYKLTLNLNKQRNLDSYSQMKKMSKTSMDYSDLNLRNLKTSQTNRETIRNQVTKAQKCLKKQQIIEQTSKQEVPSCIKDIVGMVNCKQQYFKTRNKKAQIQTKASFQFQTHKIPIFIQQKYKHLLMRLKAK